MTRSRPSRPGIDTNTMENRSMIGTGLLALAGTFVVMLVASLVFARLGMAGKPVAIGVVVVLAFGSFLGFMGWAAGRTSGRVGKARAEAAQRRRAVQASAAGLGWTWAAAAPAPAPELCEAVFRQDGADRLWPIGMSEVVTGRTRGGHEFFAGHLVGYAVPLGRGVSFGWRREENVVGVHLPGLLPELRLVDEETPDGPGLGAPLAPVASPPGLSPRWRLEGFTAPFAADLCSAEVLRVLDGAPVGCTTVTRSGWLLCCRDLVADAASIRERVDFLDRLVAAVPAACWGRADAAVAGAGVFPTHAYPGTMNRPERHLSAGERIPQPDWDGGEAALVPWEQAPDAPESVRMPSIKRYVVTRTPTTYRTVVIESKVRPPTSPPS